MYNSIQQFNESGIKNLEKTFLKYSQDITKFAEMIESVTHEIVQLGLNMVAEELEYYDEQLRQNRYMRSDWHIVKRDESSLITTLGTLRYRKTLFIHKQTKERAYLLDRVMGIAPHTRLSEDAVAKLLKEAVESSYQKAGDTLCLSGEQISRETVMNKIHDLHFPPAGIPAEKKTVPYLYIDADEDHVPLQHREPYELLHRDKYGKNTNSVYSKLIYVYEGIESETLCGSRNRLKNPHYFARVCKGKDNDTLWDEVQTYLENHYELAAAEDIYLNADGGGWIKNGMKRLENVVYVLDEFHLRKYITKLSRHMKDSAGDVADELSRLIRRGTKEEFKQYAEGLMDYLPEGANETSYRKNMEYILQNWSAAKVRLQRKDGVLGSSTEGHVSHVLADRMSSRPMGWSIIGASKMSELRAWYYNDGDMLELVRYQKEYLPMAAGMEDTMTIGARLNMAERRMAHTPTVHSGVRHGSLSVQVRKKMAIRHAVDDLRYL